MKTVLLSVCAASLAAAAVSFSTARANTVSATIADVSSESTNYGRLAIHCVDGSGLDASNPPAHGTTASPKNSSTMWMTTGNGNYNTGSPDPDRPGQLGHITFGFGQTFLLSSFRIWNYNEVNLSSRSVKNLTISVSLDGSNFRPLISPTSGTTTWTFAQAPGSTGYTGQVITFGESVSAAYVRFDILSNYGEVDDFVGLSEIRFDGSICTAPPAGMVGWWTGDENTTDIQGGNTGTWMGGGPTYAAGEVAQAFSFDGADEVRIGNPSALRLTSAITIDAWINPTALPGTGNLMAVFSKWSQDFSGGAGADSYSLWVEDTGADTLRLFCGIHQDTTLNEPLLTGGSIPLNTFSHVAMTYDGSTGVFSVYVNGQQVASQNVGAFPILATNAEVAIGHEVSGEERYFSGLIDEVEVFSTAVSAADIARIYQAGPGGKCKPCTPPPANMISWWSGDSHPNDLQGANHGAWTGPAKYGPGKVANAFEFNGADASSSNGNMVTASGESTLELTGKELTIDGWIFPRANTSAFYFGKSAPSNHPYIVYFNSSTNHVTVITKTSNNQLEYDTGYTPAVNTWTHLAMVYEGDVSQTVKLYANGIEVFSAFQSGNLVSSPTVSFGIGNRAQGAGNSFDGFIDEVEVFDRALARSEVQALYAAASVGKCKPPPNEAPVAVDDVLSDLAEDSGTRTIAFADLLANDSPPSSEPDQTLTITDVGNAVGGSVEISGSNVEFTPDANYSGSASFDYTVRDNGTTDGVDDFKTDTGNASFNITAVNDPPSFSKGADEVIEEDAGAQTASGWATNISAGAGESGQTLTFNVSVTGTTGNLTFASAPAIDASSGDLTYTVSGDKNGTASVSVTLSDNGSGSNTSGAQTFTITVNEVNDAPTSAADALSAIAEDSDTRTIPFSSLLGNDSAGPAEETSGQSLTVNAVGDAVGGSVSISGTDVLFTPTTNFHGAASFKYTAQDNGTTDGSADPKTSVTATVSFEISGITDTPSVTNAATNEDTQSSSGLVITRNAADGAEVTHFKITGITNGTLFQNDGTTAILSGSFVTAAQGAAGLKFTPASNLFSPSTAFSFKAQGATSSSGAGLSSGFATATITVSPVADTPSITNATTNEDTQTSSGLVISRNAADGTEVTRFKITNISGGTLFQHDGTTAITDGDFITAAQGAAGLRFTPAANSNTNGTFKVQSSLSANDTGLGGGTATATITISAIADTPSVTDATTNEDTQTTSGLVITPNAADGTEVTHFKISGITNGTLYKNNGTTVVANNGFLTRAEGAAGLKFTPATNSNSNGSFKAQSSLTNSDAGLGGALATAMITVNAINDAPTLDAISDATIDEDSAQQNVNLTGIGAGGGESQTLTVTATSDNPTVLPNPTVNYTSPNETGSLLFNPAANQNGSAEITVTVNDGGGTANGGVATVARTFTVTVTAVNDAPKNSVPVAQSVAENNALVFSTARNNRITASDVDANGAAVQVNLQAAHGTLTLPGTTGLSFSAGDGSDDPAMTFTGTIANINLALDGLAFAPEHGFSGTASVQINTSDQGSSGTGGAQTDTDLVEITVLNGGALAFSAPNYNVAENGSVATITVQRTGGAAGEARIDYATSDGTATAGSDYIGTTGTIIFADGVTSQTFTVAIKNDAKWEGAEKLNLALTNAAGSGALGAAATATLTITEDDPKPKIQWSKANYSVNESAGSVTLLIKKTGATALAATVHYATANGTATAGKDYIATSGAVTFAPGQASKNVSVPIVNDTSREANQTFTVKLTGPARAARGSPAIATVTINANDKGTASATESIAPTPTYTATGLSGSAINISTRAYVGAGDRVLIGGFIVRGEGSKKLLLRALGRSLEESDQINDVLEDPVLELRAADGSLILANDDWKTAQQQQPIEDTGMAPVDDRESAMVVNLAPGAYTMKVHGKGGARGTALVEAYDLNPRAPSQLANMSTRAFVGIGDHVLVGGFVLASSGQTSRVAIRGLGASLGPVGIAKPLSNPTLEIRDANGTRLAFNNDYTDDQAQAAELAIHGLAPTDPKESAICVGLPPGAYTVVVAGNGKGSGVALLEIYNFR